MDVEHLKKLQKKHSDLPFLPERMKINFFFEKLVSNLHDKENYVVHIKQTLNHGLVLKKVHRLIKNKTETIRVTSVTELFLIIT